MTGKTFEQQFFTWNEWDKIGVAVLEFHECVMVSDFGQLKIGTKFANIVLDYSTGTCAAWTSDDVEPSVSFRFTLTEVK